jgi:hypothetical protein
MSNASNTVSNNFATSPKTFFIEKAILTTNKDKEIDLKNIIQDIKVSESIYQSGIIVSIFVLDTVALIDRLKLAGNEKIDLVIQRREITNREKKKFELSVNIAEIKDYSEPRPSSRSYTLQCLSKHVYLNNTRVLKKSFEGSISKLISNIVTSELQSKMFYRNTSTNNIKGIYPRIRPLSAIHWLLRNAYEDGTPYFFYETTKNGITLDSYKHLLDQDVFHTYDNIPNFKNTARDKLEDLYEEERSKIKKVNSQMNISKFKGLSAGAYGSQLHKIDIYDKKVEAPIKYRYKAPYKLNANAPITADMKIANTTLTQIDEAKNYFISYNSGSYSNFENYHSPTDQSILKAEAYHHNLNSIIQEITIPGDFDLESGNLIELSIQKSADVTEEILEGQEFKDEMLSGKHLVTGIVHHFSSEGYFMKVKAKKDSFIKGLDKGL